MLLIYSIMKAPTFDLDLHQLLQLGLCPDCRYFVGDGYLVWDYLHEQSVIVVEQWWVPCCC